MSFSRPGRARNRLIILFIFLACLTSLYVLLLKIRRMVHLVQMEENSRHVAIINDIVYYNSSLSRMPDHPNFVFLITSHINNFYLPMTCNSNDGYESQESSISLKRIGESLIVGTCQVVNDPLFVSLKLDDFTLQIDSPDIPVRVGGNEEEDDNGENHVICMSHLVLYEDGSTILSLLKHFKNSATKIMIYAASVSDELYHAMRDYSPSVEVVPWMLPETRKHDNFNKLKLNPNDAQAAAEASLAHCFLKWAPTARKLTLIDLATLRFNSAPFDPNYILSKNLTSFVNNNWKIEKLVNFRVTVNSQNDVVLHERCFIKPDQIHGQIECGNLADPNTNSSLRSLYIPKVVEFDNYSMYSDALGRCTSYKSQIEERQKIMKFEFELENRVSSEVCEIELLRDEFKCRVAMDYIKKMFRRRTRLLITYKRAFLRFHDGCHL